MYSMHFFSWRLQNYSMKATNKVICTSAYIRNIKFTYTILGAHNHKNTLGSDTAKSSLGNTQTNSGSAGDVQDERSLPATPPSDGRARSGSASSGLRCSGRPPPCLSGGHTARSRHSRRWHSPQRLLPAMARCAAAAVLLPPAAACSSSDVPACGQGTHNGLILTTI
jgi:hypothetical protein